MWVVGLETPEYFDDGYVNSLAKRIKDLSGQRVGVHAQGNKGIQVIKQPQIDFGIYEFEWHPLEGDSKSPEAIYDIAKSVSGAVKKPLIFGEYNWNSLGGRAQSQGLACAFCDTTRVFGIGNAHPRNLTQFMEKIPAGADSYRTDTHITMLHDDDNWSADLTSGEFK